MISCGRCAPLPSLNWSPSSLCVSRLVSGIAYMVCCTDGVMLEMVCVQPDLLWKVCPHLFSRPSPSSPCVSRLVSGIVCMMCYTDGVMLEIVCVQADLLWEVCPPPFSQLVTIVPVCVNALAEKLPSLSFVFCYHCITMTSSPTHLCDLLSWKL